MKMEPFEIKLDRNWSEEIAKIKLEEQLAIYKAMCIKDHSKAHPMMKQQYTYNDLKTAYEASIGVYSELTFEEWYKNFKPEMYDGNK